MRKEFTLDQLQEIAQLVLHSIRTQTQSATILCLTGDLGAGKTTLAQTIGKILGIEQTMISPTFVIMKRYAVIHNDFDALVHIDAYRLETPEEIVKLGWNSVIKNPRNLIVVEWPEKIKSVLPDEVLGVTIEHLDEKKRILII